MIEDMLQEILRKADKSNKDDMLKEILRIADKINKPYTKGYVAREFTESRQK